jgi:hypothetical protein
MTGDCCGHHTTFQTERGHVYGMHALEKQRCVESGSYTCTSLTYMCNERSGFIARHHSEQRSNATLPLWQYPHQATGGFELAVYIDI